MGVKRSTKQTTRLHRSSSVSFYIHQVTINHTSHFQSNYGESNRLYHPLVLTLKVPLFAFQWRDYLTIKVSFVELYCAELPPPNVVLFTLDEQLVNIVFFLWFTALDFFIFSLAWGIKESNPQKYGYGIGKEVYLTPSTWIFGILFVVHLLLAANVLYVQWTVRGKEMIIEKMTL